MNYILPVILSGGSGTRLWPLSREKHPKQLIPLIDDLSLLQTTAMRLDGYSGTSRIESQPLVVCNEEYRFITAEQLRQIGHSPKQLVLEPAGRNTAPALTLAALLAVADDHDPILLVMPADHVIGDLSAFHAVVMKAEELAMANKIVTFGIVPSVPETGYGYIRGVLSGEGGAVRRVEEFIEKPGMDTAQCYVDDGNYFWNSGIFMLRASVWLRAISRYRHDILSACELAIAGSTKEHDFLRVDKSAFMACPSDSIDYAVMEKVVPDSDAGMTVVMVPLAAEWSDVGAWDSLWDVCSKDMAGNAQRGDVILHHTRNSMVIAESRLVTCIGIEDLVVVETPDVVMVTSKEYSQEVKRVVAQLKSAQRTEVSSHRKIFRPWGYYDLIDNGERFQVKRIVVHAGASLSMQMHHHRAEHWVVVRGTAEVTCGDETMLLTENQSTYIPLGQAHRLANPGKVPLEIIEVQSGSYLGEDDIVRFSDRYGR